MKQAEDDAIRIALGPLAGNAGSSASEMKFIPGTGPTKSPGPSSTTDDQWKESGEESEKESEKEAGNEAIIGDESSVTSLATIPQGGAKHIPISPLPLILYAYSESETARPNLEFFIRHALNSAADFIFILNGPTDAANIIPTFPNIRIIQRENDCYDLGAYAEVLQKDNLWKRYEKFIMLNASLRGPFMPYWSGDCWMDMYLRKLTEEVKVLSPFSPKSPPFNSSQTNQTNARNHSSSG
jgi:hypothetical protein